MAFEQPLNLLNLFVNTIAGNIEIFIFIFILFTAGLAARFRMPNSVFLIMMSLFTIFIAGYARQIFLLAIVLSGIIVFFALDKAYR